MEFSILGSDPPPPSMENFSMYFFSETRPLFGHFLKKCFFPLEMSNTCKNFQNPNIAGKWLSIGPPPLFSPKIFFTKMTQNGLKWILNTTSKSMEFCRSDPPPRLGKFHTFFFFFEGFPNFLQWPNISNILICHQWTDWCYSRDWVIVVETQEECTCTCLSHLQLAAFSFNC